ncbi:MAG: type II toxin-antitoxin system RelE/ParE family toxin [Candidatus Bipolaricaulota bacterium]|nr:type II toxin-antitoxin system RelE/ParE family toxin [Candidatus Bipolaricaulota bacterium]
MAYTRCAFPRFNRVKKKLPAPLRAEVDTQVDLICASPRVGEQKRGDLSEVFVHKFRLAGQLYLIAYLVDEAKKIVTLLALGGHENLYRDLKRYLAS